MAKKGFPLPIDDKWFVYDGLCFIYLSLHLISAASTSPAQDELAHREQNRTVFKRERLI
jgi:hypothetical protein